MDREELGKRISGHAERMGYSLNQQPLYEVWGFTVASDADDRRLTPAGIMVFCLEMEQAEAIANLLNCSVDISFRLGLSQQDMIFAAVAEYEYPEDAAERLVRKIKAIEVASKRGTA